MSLRVAIVGAGLMGRWHAAYATREGAEIAAIVDVRSEAAEGLKRQYPRALVCAALADCLRDADVEVVHVCSDSESHVALATEALWAGKHVLVEKPIGPSVDNVQKMIDLAAAKSAGLCAVHQFGFQRGFRKLVADIGRVGEIVRIQYRIQSAGGAGRPANARRQMLVEMLPHAAGLFCRLPLKAPELPKWRIIQTTDDELELATEQDGRTWRVEFNLSARPTCNELTVAGTAGTATIDLFHDFIVWDGGRASRGAKIVRPLHGAAARFSAAGWNLMRRTLRREPAYPGLRTLIRQFYRSVAEGTPSPVSAEEMIGSAQWTEFVGKTT